MQDIIFKLVKAGLSFSEAQLYVFILNHPGCCMRDAIRSLQSSKSSLYRTLEELIKKELVCSRHEDWKYTLIVNSFECVVNMLQKRQEQDLQLIHYFESLEQKHSGLSSTTTERQDISHF